MIGSRLRNRRKYKVLSLEERKQRHKEAARKYAINNVDKVKASKLAYREKNRQLLRDKNKAYYIREDRGRLAVNYKREKKRRAIEYLGGVCKDCNGVFPDVCYDFHHKNPKNKLVEICQILTSNWETILQELKKCVLLCSNCHRVRHQKESGIEAKKRKEQRKAATK